MNFEGLNPIFDPLSNFGGGDVSSLTTALGLADDTNIDNITRIFDELDHDPKNINKRENEPQGSTRQTQGSTGQAQGKENGGGYTLWIILFFVFLIISVLSFIIYRWYTNSPNAKKMYSSMYTNVKDKISSVMGKNTNIAE